MNERADAGPVDDEELPGLAGERTEMAWSRSGLALLSAAAALIKMVLVDREPRPASVVIYALLGVGVVCWAAALLHARVVARDVLEGRRVDNVHTFRVVTIGTTTFGLAALALAVVHPR